MIYQQLAMQYGYTPKQINDLTLFQLAALLGGITPETWPDQNVPV